MPLGSRHGGQSGSAQELTEEVQGRTPLLPQSTLTPRKGSRPLTRHLWAHRDDLLPFLRQPGLDATNWRAELAIRFGVILRKVWCGNCTWAGARAQSVLMSVWRTCWQQGRSALDFLSQVLRGALEASGPARVISRAFSLASPGRAREDARGGH